MTPTPRTLRRGLFAIFAAVASGGAAVAALTVPTPSATAAPDPCAASQVAKTIGSVANNTGAYLDSNPETNQALSTISQQGGPQSLVGLKAYFDANPEVSEDLQQLQQPLTTLSGRCKLPLTLPQMMGLMQAAQQNGGLTGGLPGGLPTPATGGAPSASLPAGSSAASPVSQGVPGSPTAAIAGLP
ncbi:hemophore [Mycobacterium deserti]|uniref:Hemophore n=1 Tax=Mycobacterium deserti TaxID=2978347 RepID=A0ABT2M9I2_9MYCO|nr:hemophore [Mycobacterium deserti]MCT7658910.1 hemophore [Mycobacterium deserti]